jgi:hypothetical protein
VTYLYGGRFLSGRDRRRGFYPLNVKAAILIMEEGSFAAEAAPAKAL